MAAGEGEGREGGGVIALALLFAPTTAIGATPAQVAAASVAVPEADRLAAARRVVDAVFPAAQREQMVASMVASTNAMVEQGLARQPELAKLIEREPRARPILDRFVKKQQARSVQRLQAGIPGMIEAMGRAYARRFTVTQLGEMQAFFETPTGRVYVMQSATIMADPDITAWQSRLMADTIASIGPDTQELVQELTALAPAGKAQ